MTNKILHIVTIAIVAYILYNILKKGGVEGYNNLQLSKYQYVPPYEPSWMHHSWAYYSPYRALGYYPSYGVFPYLYRPQYAFI